MRCAGLIVALILGTSSLVGTLSAQVRLTPSSYTDHALVFITSPDAPGTVDQQKVRQAYTLLAQRLKVPEAELPHVIVIRPSAQLAHAAAVSKNTLRRNAGEDGTYYELWIVEKPHLGTYIGALCKLLDKHFNLQLSDEQRTQASRFVLRLLSGTVSAHAEHPATGQK